jgi:asparagine synthase (glutamine-hydrolysing)
MCGIVGLLSIGDGTLRQPVAEVARSMANSLVHRGPDDAGVWEDSVVPIALGHRRLAIVDISAAGHQPMPSSDGRFVIAFNGEIYNHLELRAEIESGAAPIQWRGHSDTETLLAAISIWGVEAALVKLVGMFAIALWDREKRDLWLVRDRMGEKPLYWGWAAGQFSFASELKAFSHIPGWKREVDKVALTQFLRYGYVPGPLSICKGIQKLMPGSWLRLSADDRAIVHGNYWSLEAMARQQRLAVGESTETAMTDKLELLLRQSVQGQMLADVPLGAFLSGGVDSSLVVAVMQSISSRPIKSFTIGFDDTAYDEAVRARAVARHLGTEHTEMYVGDKDVREVIPRLPTLYDEPFADSSQVPTFLLAQLARQHVTVALSGDGGDELFGGYDRYRVAKRLWSVLSKWPTPCRRLAAAAVIAVPGKGWQAGYMALRKLRPATAHVSDAGDKLLKLAELLPAATDRELHLKMVSLKRDPRKIVIDASDEGTERGPSHYHGPSDFIEKMMYLDSMVYLPDDILVKVDRAAMGVSLETRVPLLDHRIVQFAWQLPLSLKIRDGQGKWLMRQVLDRYVPRSLIERPKVGFSAPIADWLRGPLREWAEALLDERKLAREGNLRPAVVRQIWEEHLSGYRNWQHLLWALLMFEAWLSG